MRAFFLLSLVFLLVPIDASAYTVIRKGNGNATIWPSNTVQWSISSSLMSDMTSDAIEEAAKEAFAAWGAVGCASIKFNFSGFKGNDPNNGIYIKFKENKWDPSVGDALAYSVSESGWGGKIESNDVVINAKDSEWSNIGSWGTNDLQGVLTHEIGHSIGMDHSREYEATMFFSGGSMKLRTLDSDDERGICFLYPSVTFTNGQTCDACDKTDQCSSGFCWSVGGGHKYCGKNCTSNNQCGEGYSCQTLDTQVSKQCWPNNGYCNQYGGNIPLGEFCYGNEVCSTGICLVTGEGAFCSQQCNGSCPAGYSCSGGFCMPAGSKPNGAECDADAECNSALCVAMMFGYSVCTQLCGQNGGSCPPGHQCKDDAVCVPPGPGSNGSPCSNDVQCQGTYCIDNKCTQVCNGSTPCPAETQCVGGYCEGSATGGVCETNTACPVGMICQYNGPGQSGSCQWKCNALSGLGCPEGQVCKWRWESWSEIISGQCVPSNGGKKAGENCDNAPCDADLICDATLGPQVLCRKDCKNDTANNLGCGVTEECVSIEDPDDPLKGLCVDENEDKPPPPVDSGGPGSDAGVPSQTDGGPATDAGPQTDGGVPFNPDSGTPGTPGTPGAPADPADGGCQSSGSNSSPIWLWSVSLFLVGFGRRRWKSRPASTSK